MLFGGNLRKACLDLTDNFFPRSSFSRINPILEVAQTFVVQATAGFQPLKHQSLLVGSWINSVGIVHSQHSSILAQGMTRVKNNFSLAIHPTLIATQYSLGLLAN
jgi:hypothetical protein